MTCLYPRLASGQCFVYCILIFFTIYLSFFLPYFSFSFLYWRCFRWSSFAFILSFDYVYCMVPLCVPSLFCAAVSQSGSCLCCYTFYCWCIFLYFHRSDSCMIVLSLSLLSTYDEVYPDSFVLQSVILHFVFWFIMRSISSVAYLWRTAFRLFKVLQKPNFIRLV